MLSLVVLNLVANLTTNVPTINNVTMVNVLIHVLWEIHAL